MKGDKLVIELDGARFALDTAIIAGIVEVRSIPFLPGQTGFVNGIISLRNEPVTVVDIRRVFGVEKKAGGSPHKVVVVREKNRLLGFDIGSADISFLWEEELKDRAAGKGSSNFTSAKLDPESNPVELIDWSALFTEAARILSTEETGV